MNTQQAPLAPARSATLRAVTFEDITRSLKSGWADFYRAPLLGLFFGGIYAAGGLFILACLTVLDIPWMIIPVAVGFPLIGPFIAVGLYETSRRIAAGEPLEWRAILTVMLRQRERQLGVMAFVVLFIFWIWIYQVRLLLALFFGFRSFASIGEFAMLVTTTADGLAFLAVGTAVGALLAFVLFGSTVIAMPYLLDREVDFVTAMIASFRTVVRNPVPMLGWGIIVAGLAFLAMLPAFLGLLVILPVLGHATWHLYTHALTFPET